MKSNDFDYSYEENVKASRNPIFLFLVSVSTLGYKRKSWDSYLRTSLPPVEFVYSKAVIQEEIRDLDPASLERLPTLSLAGHAQFMDLTGSGHPDLVTFERTAPGFYERTEDGA